MVNRGDHRHKFDSVPFKSIATIQAYWCTLDTIATPALNLQFSIDLNNSQLNFQHLSNKTSTILS